jgi:hypothetical protein
MPNRTSIFKRRYRIKRATWVNTNFYFLQLLPGNYQFYASKVGYNTQCICCRQDDQELDAGFEYLSEVYLAAACY